MRSLQDGLTGFDTISVLASVLLELIERLVQPIAIEYCDHQRISDKSRTANGETKAHKIGPGATCLVWQLRTESQPWQEVVGHRRGKGLEIKRLTSVNNLLAVPPACNLPKGSRACCKPRSKSQYLETEGYNGQ